MVVGEYVRLQDAAPRELFIHAKCTPSRLSLTRNGWGSAAAKARISWASKIAEERDDLKLFRPCDYRVSRGTALQIGDRRAFLWTAGYAPRLDTFMGQETPNPISVKVLTGNCSLQAVLSDMFGLNQDQLQLVPSQRLPACDAPICQCGGGVLISAPMDSEPKLPFKSTFEAEECLRLERAGAACGVCRAAVNRGN